MVRWSETASGYLLRVSKAEEAAALVALGLLCVGAAAVLFLEEKGLLLHPCCGGPVLGGCALSWLAAWLRSEYSAWLEVPIRHGPIRWGCPGVPPQALSRVARFDVEVVGEWGIFSRPHHHVVAVREGGEQVRVLGYWESVDRGRVEGIVAQLNQLLGAGGPA